MLCALAAPATAAVLAATLAASAGAASSVAPFAWSGPIAIAPAGEISDVSCASDSLCVAVDRGGGVSVGTEPANPASWSFSHIDESPLTAVSCSPQGTCVAGDAAGGLMVSSDPAAGATTWNQRGIDTGHEIEAVSCPSDQLCVAVDSAGDVLSSTQPDGKAWSTVNVDEGRTLWAISCSSEQLCVATDGAGDVLTSTQPTGGRAAWSIADVDGADPIGGISCLGSGFCVATDGGGNGTGTITTSDPAAGAAAWTAHAGGRDMRAIWCVSQELCVAAEGGVDEVSFPDAVSLSEIPGEGSGWQEQFEEPAGYSGVSCPSAALCVIGLAEPNGHVIVGLGNYPMSVRTLGGGDGRVESEPAPCGFTTCTHTPTGLVEPLPVRPQVSCGHVLEHEGLAQNCLEPFVQNTLVPLNTVASPGSYFAGWSGACSGTAGCDPLMDGPVTIDARFELGSAPAPVPAGSPPVITALHQSASIWRQGGRLAGDASRRRPPVGTTFAVSISEAATLTFRFERLSAGTVRAGLCRRLSARGHRGVACTLRATSGRLSVSGRGGANRVTFDGLLSRGNRIAPGRYEVLVAAANSAGTSASRSLRFTLER